MGVLFLNKNDSIYSNLKNFLNDLLKKQEKEIKKFFNSSIKLNKNEDELEDEFARILSAHKEEISKAITNSEQFAKITQAEINDFINKTFKERQESKSIEKIFNEVEQEL